MKAEVSNNGCIGFTGFTGFLIVAFILTVLKLTKVIDWSWWWVLSPIWVTIIMVVLIVIALVCFRKY